MTYVDPIGNQNVYYCYIVTVLERKYSRLRKSKSLGRKKTRNYPNQNLEKLPLTFLFLRSFSFSMFDGYSEFQLKAKQYIWSAVRNIISMARLQSSSFIRSAGDKITSLFDHDLFLRMLSRFDSVFIRHKRRISTLFTIDCSDLHY